MSQTYNIYCDESCHLEHDSQRVMVLGAVSCPADKTKEISRRIIEIKLRHGLSGHYEAKWTKVSPSKQSFYLDLADYFFDDDDLRFRALVVPDKSLLRHGDHGQDHDTWYYKMFYTLLDPVLGESDRHRIYLDIKDTRGEQKRRKLHDVLCNANRDFDRNIIERIQPVRSHEAAPLQLADVLIGAVSYISRKLHGSTAKQAVVSRVQERSQLSLAKTTLLGARKVNLLIWQAQEPVR